MHVAVYVPIFAIPALVAVMGAVFVYAGVLRLAGMKHTPSDQRGASVVWGLIGVGIGVATIAGAIQLYRGV